MPEKNNINNDQANSKQNSPRNNKPIQEENHPHKKENKNDKENENNNNTININISNINNNDYSYNNNIVKNENSNIKYTQNQTQNKNNSSSKIKNLFNENNDKTQEIELYKKYSDEPSEDNNLLIPTLKPDLFENKIFNNDAFRNGIRKSQYENDPRDAPIDNIRRKYPKIVEEQSSYLGEWKNGKRDGLGLLSWGNESKFFGHF